MTLSVPDEGYTRNAPRALNIWIRRYTVNIDNKAYLDICSFKLTLTYVILVIVTAYIIGYRSLHCETFTRTVFIIISSSATRSVGIFSCNDIIIVYN